LAIKQAEVSLLELVTPHYLDEIKHGLTLGCATQCVHASYDQISELFLLDAVQPTSSKLPRLENLRNAGGRL
jgi:hypothetical protein